MILTATPSILEWVLMGLGLTCLIVYIVISVYRKKHPKNKNTEED